MAKGTSLIFLNPLAYKPLDVWGPGGRGGGEEREDFKASGPI